MRRPARYPAPLHADPRDTRMVSLVKGSSRAASGSFNIMGVPFDGAVLGRKGAAEGPAGIRESMRFFSTYSPELGLDLSELRIRDLGDVVLGRKGVLQAHEAVEREVRSALYKGSLLAVLGGDNSVSLPAIRACSKRFGRLGLIVFDSHFDLRRPVDGKPTSGSSYGIALRTLQGLSAKRAVEVGIHGFLNSRLYAEEARRMGLATYTAGNVKQIGAERVVREAYKRAVEGSDAVYVSVDMDSVDLSFVSGVSAPSVGGLDATDLFAMLNFLGSREEVVCADIVELAPPLDPTWRSQITAATALVSLIAGFASRGSAGPGKAH